MTGVQTCALPICERYLRTPDQVSSEPRDCIIVLGAGVYGNGKPTKILQDRLDRGIELYKAGAAPKLLLSGDNGKANYDEVKVMRNYCLEHGVSAEDIFLDHAGFSTYESMYRARAVFGVNYLINRAGLYYKTDGVFNTQEELDNYPHWTGARLGDIKFVDYNNDGKINADDRVRSDKNQTPRLVTGFNVGLNWNHFDLAMLFQASS